MVHVAKPTATLYFTFHQLLRSQYCLEKEERGCLPCFYLDLVLIHFEVHSKTRTSVQLGILLGLSGDSGDGMGGGGGSDDGFGRVGEGLCYALI